MHHTMSLIGGAGFGVGLMYFLDPDRGRRRRALMRDKSIRWSRKTREFAGSTSRDMRNRARGMGAAVKSWVQPTPPVPDNVLAERIRSKIGMFSRHPSAIDVHVTAIRKKLGDAAWLVHTVRGVGYRLQEEPE